MAITLVNGTPKTKPYVCCGCKTGRSEYSYVKLNIFIEFYGDLYLCEFCVNTVELLLDRGVLVEQRQKIEELEAENERGRIALDSLNAIRDTISILDLVAPEIEQGTTRRKLESEESITQ
jgi:hypothetical protein